MSNFTVTECMADNCTSELPGAPGVFYCEGCVQQQLEEWEAEQVAFKEYHAWADQIARD